MGALKAMMCTQCHVTPHEKLHENGGLITFESHVFKKMLLTSLRRGPFTEKMTRECPQYLFNLWVHNLVMSLDFGEMTELKKNYLSGWVGYFSYDTVCYVEKRKFPFSKALKDDRNLADIHLGLYDDVLVFDHVDKKLYVTHWVRLDRYYFIETAYEDGVKHLASLLARVQSLTHPRLSAGFIDIHTHHFGGSLENSNMTSEEYKKVVLEVKKHILAGDIFQIVLSQHFERRIFADHLKFIVGCILVSSSLEILTHVNKRKLVNRPLAGTTRRGKTSKEDENLELQLLSNEKQSTLSKPKSSNSKRKLSSNLCSKWLPKLKLAIFLLLATNIPMALGTEDVMNHLSKEALEDKVNSVLFLMPCHATPCYSTLYSALQHPYAISRLHTKVWTLTMDLTLVKHEVFKTLSYILISCFYLNINSIQKSW
ncbi:hypothetical protein UlMin_010338 [Ulmus minor]